MVVVETLVSSVVVDLVLGFTDVVTRLVVLVESDEMNDSDLVSAHSKLPSLLTHVELSEHE